MNNLADLYRYGRGVAPDLPAAANWYLKAAKLGLASAMNSLGELSEAGTGVPQNYQTAKNWYKKAADLGNADAMGNLGALFESGRGGPQLLEPHFGQRRTINYEDGAAI
jgi:TPR repeat protein